MQNPAKKRKMKAAAILYGLGAAALVCRLFLREGFVAGLAAGFALAFFVSGIAISMQARAEPD